MTTSVLGQKRWSCPLRPFTRDELANNRSFLTWLWTGLALFVQRPRGSDLRFGVGIHEAILRVNVR